MNVREDAFVTEWVLETVREKYRDDIALVVSHNTLRMDDTQKGISYFVPTTKRGYALARTFILAGIGYDIWAIPWSRLEGFARLEEYNITCLADGEILYAGSEADRERFLELQRALADNLADPKKVRACALSAYEQAKQIYLEMLFAKGSDVRLGAGYTLDYLARAVAFSNGCYFKRAQTDQLAELAGMERVPAGFDTLYREVIFTEEDSIRMKTCYELLCSVRDFLAEASDGEEERPEERNFQDLADWYAELSYTWLRIRYYAQKGDAVKTYMWGICLQQELNQVCRDFGLPKMELLESFRPDNLDEMVARADALEIEMRRHIVKNGGIIHAYATREEFLREL